MNRTLFESKTKFRCDPAKAADSICDTDLESNEIDDSELQRENTMNKQFQRLEES
jgi:hypothetical protein